MKVLTGDEVSQELYLKTWELDNETFDKSNQVSKELALEWFYASGKSIIICCDDLKTKVYGYFFPFLLKHTFASKYLTKNISFKNIAAKDFFDTSKEGNADLYIVSTVVREEYRNESYPEGTKPIFKILNEAFLDWICKLKTENININYVFAEKVSADGEKYLKTMGLIRCFEMANDCKYATMFSPKIFSRCDNVDKLYSLYEKEENAQFSFDSSILENHSYLKIKNGNLFYKDVNLYELAKKYGTPLEVAYTDMISERINYLKSLFNNEIEKAGYKGDYKYAYATKANYYSEVVLTALKNVDFLETSSAYDIGLIVKLAKLNLIKKGFTVICNGFKNQAYIQSVAELIKRGINVIPVIENEKEFEFLEKIGLNIDVGLRYNSDFESRLIKSDFKNLDEFDNRFGFNKTELSVMAKKIKKSKKLTLKILHFHFGGTITNIDNYVKGFANIFAYYCELKKENKSLTYFDFGGGFPVKYSLTFEFDYELLVKNIVNVAKTLSENANIEAPVLIGEHGRFTVADHSFYIYKIDFNKQTNNHWWYIINGSLMNMTPDVWGVNQDFTILPLNLLNKKCIPVCLGGETCDPDDRYFLKDKNVNLFLPKIDKGETLYIAVFSIGAYQEIISGIGGVHHCMLPEGNELIIYRDEKTKELKFEKVNDVQTIEEMLSLLSYNDKNYINKFK